MAGDLPVSRYARVLHGSLGHPKFVGLTAAQRGTWVTALVLADIAYPEPIHESAVRLHCHDAEFDELYQRELIERNGKPGWLYVHDLKQFHVVPSSTPEAVRERKRRSRANKRKDVTPVTHVTPVTNVTTDGRDELDELDESESFSGVCRPSPARAERPKVRGFTAPGETA